MRGDFAHVGIAGGKSPGMLDLDVIAMAAMTTRIDDLAVSHRVNGRAIARTEINACMHAAITQYGMPAQSIRRGRSEEHTSELQTLMRISYAVFCLKKKKTT